MKIGKIGITPKFLESFEKLTKKQQMDYVFSVGDYKHQKREVVEKECETILIDIKNADDSASKEESKETNKSANRKRSTKNSASGSKQPTQAKKTRA